ncbi:histidine phosphatase family protein [Persicobacter sp. CCB-QB2]|uniref:histidine phosphatase family protein n=1 Tax=Persicobacter sp. CCB-QB2 TaxID=1561025 RepID=UPI0006A95D1B|nr:histidine phosphatase family protein [Persicobacter sp. CCB-QB2]
MKRKKLYIIRHGQTDLNKKGIVQGSGVDSSLNDLGRAQASAFYEKYKDFPFEKVYTSALKRTKETVLHFEEAGFVPQELPGLNEISWGVVEGKSPTPENKARYQALLQAWADGDLSQKYEGGESLQEVVERQKVAIDHILAQEEECVLVAMHGRAMRILLGWWVNDTLIGMDQFSHSNLSLYEIDWESDKGPKIVRFDDRSHLEHL